tara:strand:- start:1618 stop:1821 length:204 start_codon:yes stop_codon:yes gene_type:complete
MVGVWITATKLIYSVWFCVANVMLVLKENFNIIINQEFGEFISFQMVGDTNPQIKLTDIQNIPQINR